MKLELTQRETPAKRLGWHALRFQADPRKVHVECRQCAKEMWLPASKVEEYRSCSQECARTWRDAQVSLRTRPCAHCGQTFTPRAVQLAQGAGRFCSQKCNAVGGGRLMSPENLALAQEGKRRAIAEGRLNYPKGENNKRWTGGPSALRARQTAAGKTRAWTRRYREENPDKVREFSGRRKGRKIGRLPRGTVKRIGDAQRWRCAVCARKLATGYHLDHIEPLARGGEHRPANLQLLCAPCNVRKSAKDPIAYMRELGRLI